MGEKYGIIYLIKNKLNNKLYFGQTIKEQGFCERYPCGNSSIERVYNYHLYRKENECSYNDHLLKSIKKYGFGVFDIDELFDIAYSKEELDSLEKLYIKTYNTTNPVHGYNKTSGGSNGKPNDEIRTKISKSKIGVPHPISKETRIKMGESRKGENNYMYGKKGELSPNYGLTRTQEFKDNISKRFKGKKLSEEQKRKVKENHADVSRGNHPQAKKIICITTKFVFNCIKNGAEYYNISYSGLKSHLQNKKSLSYGETLDGEKLTWDYYENYIKENNEEGLIYEENLRTIK